MRTISIRSRRLLRAAAAIVVLGCGTAAAVERDALEALLAGEFSVQSGDSRSAAHHYLAAALASADPAVAERAARIALLAEELAVAGLALDRWRDLAPGSPGLHQTRAQLALRRGEADAAVAALSDLLGSPGSEGWQRALQVLAVQQGDRAVLAAGVLSRLLELPHMPDVPEAWFAFGGLATRLQDDALAARLAERAAERFPDSPRIRLWQAQRQRLAGDAAGARATVLAALQAPGAEDTGVRLMAAAELDQIGDSRAAAAVLAEGPQNADILLGRVAYLARAEDTDALGQLYELLAAGEHAAQAPGGDDAAGLHADLPPADDDTRFLLGQLAELLKRHEEALDWYGKVVGARRSEAALRQAVALEALGRRDAAQALLREVQAAEQADGESVRNAYLLEAEILLGRGDADAAIAAYGRGLGIFEDDPQLLYARGLALAEHGEVTAAEADLARLIAMDPDNADALNALGYTLADRTDRLQEAHDFIRRAHTLMPDSAAIIDSLGWVLFRLGRTDEALVQLRRAFSLQPDPEIAAHLGEVLWVTGARDEAREVWGQGRALEQDNAVLRETVQRLDAQAVVP